MDKMYWMVALWVIVGFIAAVAFGFFSNQGQDNDNSVSKVKQIDNFHRHPMTSAVNAGRARPIPSDVKKTA